MSIDLTVPDDGLARDGGWHASAPAWIEGIERDMTRKMLDPLVLHLCGDVTGRRALDVGSGEGRFARMLAERGAECIGIDPTPALVAAARDRGNMSPVRAVAEAMSLRDGAFDLAVSYITLVDIEGYVEAIAEMARSLRPGGRLVAVNIGFASASVAENHGWQRDDDGNELFVPIDNYGSEWSAVLEWNGLRIRNWHRPLSAYMAGRAYSSTLR
ncbi:MAG: class I SAM-dependent methyltransferase [Dehalococcoidia bacterium]